jgi:ABC-type glycerol-3-phosphate transport system substrate-binding protein
VTDVADYLGKKYGGRAPSAIVYGKGTGNRWIGIPTGFGGSIINYRISSLRKAGYSKFPESTTEFLDYAKAAKANIRPDGVPDCIEQPAQNGPAQRHGNQLSVRVRSKRAISSVESLLNVC